MGFIRCRVVARPLCLVYSPCFCVPVPLFCFAQFDGTRMELEEDQRTILKTVSKQVRQATALLRSINPESFRAAERAKRICDQVGAVGWKNQRLRRSFW